MPHKTNSNRRSEHLTMPSTLDPKKRPAAGAKKRKVQVSIGSSRPEEPEEEEEHVREVTETQEISIAPVAGKPTLQTYCSKYRTKGKRQAPKKQKVAQKENNPASITGAEQGSTAGGPVVQVVNGEIVLQESSMVVPGARRSVQEVEEEFEQVVEEEVQHSAVVGASYNSFVSRRAPQHWNVAETKKFYNALRQVGPDFATMAAYFDNRTRKQLKRKYQIENTKNPHLIELSLSPQSQIPLDLSVFNMGPGGADRAKATTASISQQNVQRLVETEGGNQSTGPSAAMEQEELDKDQPEPVEDTGTTSSAIPLPAAKAKAKRPMFKASRRKAKGRS